MIGILFNDIFGSREDYSKGMFYHGRRRYLSEEFLEPPSDFKTKQQVKKAPNTSTSMSRNGLNLIDNNISNNNNLLLKNIHKNQEKFTINFAKKKNNDDNNNDINNNSNNNSNNNNNLTKNQLKQIENNRIKNNKNKKYKTILISKYSSIDKNDWIEEFQAGCQIWINISTGEVSSECPWIDRDKQHLGHSNSQNKSNESSDDEYEGTGAMVYDSSEVDELFEILEKYSNEKSHK